MKPHMNPFVWRRLSFSLLIIGSLLAIAFLLTGSLPGRALSAKPFSDPQPVLNLHLKDHEFPSQALIGEEFCYTARITNTGNNTGYGPYLRLIIPVGLKFSSASTPGICNQPTCTPADSYPLDPSLVKFVGTFNAGNSFTLIDPLSQTNVAGPDGGQFYTIQAPAGSLYTSEPGIDIQICLTVDPDAKLGVPLAVCHTPVYQHGDSATGTTAIVGDADCPTVTPVVVILTKRSDAPPSNKPLPLPQVETAAGDCHIIKYQLVANIADTRTLTNLVFNDMLPPEMALVPNTITVTGVSMSATTTITPLANGFQVIVSEDTGAIKGSKFDTEDVVVEFQAYVIASDPNNCAPKIVINTAKLDAEYENKSIKQQTAALPMFVKNVALQKGAAGPHAPADPVHVVPGDIVNYALSYQVSKGISFLGFLITDTLPNGISYVGNAFISATGLGTVPITPTVTVNQDGTTTLMFDPPVAFKASCISAVITYQGKVEQNYVTLGSPVPVLASDQLVNNVFVRYSINAGAKNCLEDALAGVIVQPVGISKTIVNPKSEYLPGDLVTFRLRMDLPSGDTKNISFTDFFPSPVFKVKFPATMSQLILLYNIHLVPGSGNVGSILNVASGADNSLKFTFADVTTATTAATTPKPYIEIELKLPITTDPFADDLFLTNLFQGHTVNTAGVEDAPLTGVVIHVRAPKLKLTKGVFCPRDSKGQLVCDNPKAVVSPTPSPDQPNPPVNGNITGVDANDIVRFYLTVTNMGGAPAYSVKIVDTLPAGLTYVAASMPNVIGPLPSIVVSGAVSTGQTITATYLPTTPLPKDESWVLEIDVKLPAEVPPCTHYTNKACVTWNSFTEVEQPGVFIGAPLFPPECDDATISATVPTVTKTLVDTNLAHTTGNNVTIGEVVTYKVEIDFPEGVFHNVKVTDTLPSGMALYVPLIPVGGPKITAVKSSANLSTGSLQSAVITSPGQLLSFEFGTVTNSDSNNNIRETISFTYSVVVLNTSTNVSGTTLSNNVKLTMSDQGCTDVTAGAPVKIVEPKLQISKAALGANNQPITTADAGDTVTFVMTVSHMSASNADAFEVELTDLIPPGHIYKSSSLMLVSGLAPTKLTEPPAPTNTSLSVKWDSFPLGQTSTIKFSTMIAGDVAPCQSLSNKADVTWASFLGQPFIYPLTLVNSLSCKRSGPPGCGQKNNYTDSSTTSLNVPGPMISKTLKDPTHDKVTIGESVTYVLKIDLPEGATPSVTITDGLPVNQLLFKSATLQNPNNLGGLSAGLLGSGPWSFGPVIVPSNNNPSDNYFIIEVAAQVKDDVLLNVGLPPQTTITNTATVKTPLCEAVFSNPVTVTVVEPRLEIKKEFIPAQANIGDTVQIKLTLTNTGTSDAFDIKVEDSLPNPPFTNVAHVTTGSTSGFTPTITPLSANTLVKYESNPGISIKPDASATLIFQTKISGTCGIYPNTATITKYSTLSGDITGERIEPAVSGSASLVVTGPDCSCVDAPQLGNMVGWWPLNESTGATVVTDILAGHNGTPKPSGQIGAGNGPSVIAGMVKGGLFFFDPNHFVQVPNEASLNFGSGDFSIDAWIKPGPVNAGKTHPIVDKLDASQKQGYALRLQDGQLQFVMGTGGLTTYLSSNSIVAGVWQHIAVTVKRSVPPVEVKFYLNGAPLTATPSVPLTGSVDNSLDLLIGGSSTPFNQFGEIGIDELEIFKVALTEAEVKSIANATSGGKCPCVKPPTHMVAWYPLDETTGTAVHDIVGAHHGVSESGPLGISTHLLPGTGMVKGAFHIINSFAGFVRVPDDSALDFGTSSFSIDAWVWVSTNANPFLTREVVDKLDLTQNKGYALYTEGLKVKFVIGDGTGSLQTFTSASSVTTQFENKAGWNHLTVTIDRTNSLGKFYLNGVSATGDSFTFKLTGNIGSIADLLIGDSRLNDGGDFFLDEIELFDAALTAEEVKPLADARRLGKCNVNCAPPPAGMVDWWPFDETTGTTAADIRGVNNSGVYQNGPTPSDGKVAKALCFDGANDYVEVADHPEVNFLGTCTGGATAENFTIDVWVKTTTNSGLQVMLDKRINPNQPVGYHFFLLDGRLGFQMADGTAANFIAPISSTNVADGQWHLVAVTVRQCGLGAGGRLYVDGNLVHSFTPLTGSINNSANLQIGRRDPAFTATYFKGCLDELEIFKRVLEPSEIQAIYTAGSAGKCKADCSTLTFGPTILASALAPRVKTTLDWSADLNAESLDADASTENISENVGPSDHASASLTCPMPLPNAAIGAAYASESVGLAQNPCKAITAGTPYSQTFIASGGCGGYSFSVTNGTLPPGLSLSSDGVLSGTPAVPPTQPAQYFFTITVTDACGCSKSQNYCLQVCPRIAVTLQPLSQKVCLGDSATFTATATSTGQTLTVKWQVSTDGGQTFTDIPNAFSTTLTTNTPGLYRAVFTGSCGGTITTNAASLTNSAFPCGLNPPTLAFAASGGNGSVNVTAPADTAWTAASRIGWVTITSGSSGNGNSTVNFTVATNPDPTSRTGLLDIAGQTLTVTQAAANNNCVPVAIVTNLIGTTGSSLTVPVTVGNLTGKGVTAFDFTLTFDPTILKPNSTPVDTAGTLSSGFTITTNAGTPGKLVISAFGTTPLTGAGTLLNLEFDLIGAISACSNLTWTSFTFNEGTPCVTTTNGRVCIVGGAISGTVNYGTAPSPQPVSGVTLTAAGTPSATSATNSAGAYNLTGLGGGPYTVTPTKTGDVNGISAFDASLVAQHVAGLVTLTANQQIAGDASGNGTLSSFDASLIAQTAAGTPNSGIAGTWKFGPTNRSYPTLSGNQTNQNFEAILVGDVSGNWKPPANNAPLIEAGSALNRRSPSSRDLPENDLSPGRALTVSLPRMTSTPGASVMIPITTDDLTGRGVVSYDFTIAFDPAVLQSPEIDFAGTLSSGMTLTINKLTPGRLTISAFQTTPLIGRGTLLYLKFTVAGAPGSATTLTWLSAESFKFNEGLRASALIDGRITVAPSAKLSPRRNKH